MQTIEFRPVRATRLLMGSTLFAVALAILPVNSTHAADNSLTLTKATDTLRLIRRGISDNVFLGYWRMIDKDTKPYYIELQKGGTVVPVTANGNPARAGRKGTWTRTEDAVLIKYASGWTDRLEVREDNFFHASYEPGLDLNGNPSYIAPAYRMELF